MADPVIESPEDNPQVSSMMLKLVIGGTIILFGVCVLINMFTRLVDTDALLQWWPAVFILVGLALASSGAKNAGLGAAIALAGVVVILDRLDLMSGDLRRFVILIAVLLIGLAVITPIVTKKPKQ